MSMNPRFFSAADAFVLTSREDPFPTVVLEAMSVGVPVVAFAESGGIPEFLTEHSCGHVVPYCDPAAVADKLKTIFEQGCSEAERARTQELIATDFAFTPYVRDLLRLALPKKEKRYS